MLFSPHKEKNIDITCRELLEGKIRSCMDVQFPFKECSLGRRPFSGSGKPIAKDLLAAPELKLKEKGSNDLGPAATQLLLNHNTITTKNNCQYK